MTKNIDKIDKQTNKQRKIHDYSYNYSNSYKYSLGILCSTGHDFYSLGWAQNQPFYDALFQASYPFYFTHHKDFYLENKNIIYVVHLMTLSDC